MGAAIWSTPVERMLDFPAENFVSFFENHKLLHWDRPVWRTVTGGSREYVAKLTAPFRDRIRTGDPVVAVTRDVFAATLTTAGGISEKYDHVVLASHCDESRAILTDASAEEAEVLASVEYRHNKVYLHRDRALMPKRKEAWAAWNFLKEKDQEHGDVCISYSMQHLQGIDPACPLFVTLNPPKPPKPELVFQTFDYAHPQFTRQAFAGQELLRRINGGNRVWFAGAWTGYGFHEDGLRSGLLAAEGLGAPMPWRDSARPALELAE
jgi:uncharacterized protein